MRDKEGVPIKYEAYSTGNQQALGERMLRETGLVNKGGVNKKKASDKINWGPHTHPHSEFQKTGNSCSEEF